MNQKKYPLPAGAEKTKKLTHDIEPATAEKASMGSALLPMLISIAMCGIFILLAIFEESGFVVFIALISMGLFLFSVIFLFRQGMVRQINQYYELARAFI